jgi:hypothetical protein
VLLRATEKSIQARVPCGDGEVPPALAKATARQASLRSLPPSPPAFAEAIAGCGLRRGERDDHFKKRQNQDASFPTGSGQVPASAA